MSKPFDDVGEDWHNRALLLHFTYHSDPVGRWSVWAAGFKEAADRLVQEIKSGRGGIDGLVHPILALYRHSIELALKGQVRELNVLLGHPPPVKPKQAKAEHGVGHDLLALWACALERARELHPSLDESKLQPAARMVAGFATIDSRGDAARYPEAMDGTPNLHMLEALNVRLLAEDMELAMGALFYIDGLIDYEKDLRSEIQAFD